MTAQLLSALKEYIDCKCDEVYTFIEVNNESYTEVDLAKEKLTSEAWDKVVEANNGLGTITIS